MDTATLVTEQIDDGRRLIEHLTRNSIPVTVAVWVLTSDEGIWLFYIASGCIDDEGPAKAYRRVYSELSRCGVQWISDSDIKIVSPDDSIAVEAVSYRHNKFPTRYGGRKLGSLIIEDAYIYPVEPSGIPST